MGGLRKVSLSCFVIAIINPPQISGLSPALRESLLLLAGETQREQLQAEMAEQIANFSKEHIDLPVFELDKVSLADWETGVEAWQKLNVADVCKLLGIKSADCFPGFNKWIDVVGGTDPWDDSDNDNTNGRQLLLPHWHQLIGMVKILDNLFDGKPILLMDGVGLGKTLQVVGVFALIAWYRDVKTKTGDYPGIFCM